MRISKLLPAIFFSSLFVVSFACQKKAANKEQKQVKETEESGTELTLAEKYDTVRNGVRLILAYDAQTNSFTGSVENTTDSTLKNVRVEVHLSSGIELGPTPRSDLAPGDKKEIRLTATSKDFNGWTVHAEVGSSEHGNREESGDHDRESSEHKSEHKREHGEEHEHGGGK